MILTPDKIPATVPQQNLPLKFVVISKIHPSFLDKLSGCLFYFQPQAGKEALPGPPGLIKCYSQPNLITQLHVKPLTL